MAMPVNVFVEASIESVLGELKMISSLTYEQRETLCTLLDGRDVCAFLPSGFGKSLIYLLGHLPISSKYYIRLPSLFSDTFNGSTARLRCRLDAG